MVGVDDIYLKMTGDSKQRISGLNSEKQWNLKKRLDRTNPGIKIMIFLSYAAQVK
jgi:hypothetical protein